MCKTVTALQLAHYVLQYTTKYNIRITHLQLQKVLYYIQGYHLQKFGLPLFEDNIEAWQYGPVISSVYRKYFVQGSLPLRTDIQTVLDVTPEQQSLINSVIEKKARLRAAQLVSATHAEAPWKDLKAQVEAGYRPIMTVDAIKRHFDSQVV